MMSSKTAISIDDCAHEQLVRLVESVTFGSDGLRYQRLDVASQLSRFNKAVFFHAFVNEQLVGVYVLDQRDLLVFNKPVIAYYRGVLAVDSSYQQRGIGKALTQAAIQWMADQSTHCETMSYGCIDKKNTRSLQLLKSIGAIEVAGLSMYMMYKQWPARHPDVKRFDDPDAAQAVTVSNMIDSDYGICDVSRSRLPLFVLEDTQGVVIRARAELTRFRIVDMSATARWCTRLFVKPFASARARFDPDQFAYVSLSNVSIRNGSEKCWPCFLSSVLCEFQCHFAVVYVDPNSALFRQLQTSGLANRLLHSSTADIAVLVHTEPTNELLVSLANSNPVVDVWPVDA